MRLYAVLASLLSFGTLFAQEDDAAWPFKSRRTR